jgi:hypothetical protein
MSTTAFVGWTDAELRTIGDLSLMALIQSIIIRKIEGQKVAIVTGPKIFDFEGGLQDRSKARMEEVMLFLLNNGVPVLNHLPCERLLSIFGWRGVDDPNDFDEGRLMDFYRPIFECYVGALVTIGFNPDSKVARVHRSLAESSSISIVTCDTQQDLQVQLPDIKRALGLPPLG